MELLHRSLGDVVTEDGPLGLKMVANMACQMINVLQHVHSYSLVHRDIKPDNIMLQSPDSWKLCLIDFGLTRPLPSLLTSTTLTKREGSNSASLNEHEKDAQLTFRDDFESLSYTLLWLLRGSLPWSHFAQSGTPPPTFQSSSGSLWSVPGPCRSMKNRTITLGLEFAAKGGALTPDRQPSQYGYTIREGHESSFIPDPLFSSPDWSTPYRPAVVTQVGWDERARKHTFLAIAISRRSNSNEDMTVRAIPIATKGSHTNGGSPTIHMEPGWPFDDAYFYVFKRPVEFYCLPSQAGRGKDIMTSLMESSESEESESYIDHQSMVGHMNTFILAGHETTSAVLTRVLDVLAQLPDI
ncbi:unnamed protein product [Rhizoctonia solani]|uniref:non-specific serine/threonine protein kinase n=1 Tax=Rhizoctonia solani TaxID=456999 RepID=A0A8H3C7A1_9AGAM|nr:unnamed protein product [Rhizoctonia solani]